MHIIELRLNLITEMEEFLFSLSKRNFITNKNGRVYRFILHSKNQCLIHTCFGWYCPGWWVKRK